MMKIPKEIKIGGHLVKVDCSKEIPDLNGQVDYQTNTIKICKTIPQSFKEAALIHEIFHLLNSTFDQDREHAIMDSLAEQWYQVLKDNKFNF